jgi:exodeoxyribonuclease-5
MPDGDFRRVVQLSAEQQRIGDGIRTWRHDPRGKQICRLDGPAGSGKTETIVPLGIELGAQFCSVTGRAASNLRQRGAENACTAHSLVFRRPTLRDGELVWKRKPVAQRLQFADECFTVDHQLGRALLATGAKILIAGDPFQLPPVSGKAFFTGEPDFTLTEIHRQAADSQPLQLATAIREGERRPDTVPFDIDTVAEADIAICALNKTRRHSTG